MLRVYVVEEDGIIDTELGTIFFEELATLIQETEELNFRCLPFIAKHEITIFNPLQVSSIEGELEILRPTSKLSDNTFDLFEKGIKESSKDVHLYLKFVPQDYDMLPFYQAESDE